MALYITNASKQLSKKAGNFNIDKSTIVDMVYPINSIYMSVNSTSPASLFGGGWTQLKDRFLLGAGDTYTGGATGGAATVTLSTNEMPSHSHGLSTATVNNGWNGVDYSTKASNYATRDTMSAGGGGAHNNMPPYLVVFIWKRIS